MLIKIWRYSLNDVECGGFVFASSLAEAKQKVKEMYEDVDEDVIKVWEANFG